MNDHLKQGASKRRTRRRDYTETEEKIINLFVRLYPVIEAAGKLYAEQECQAESIDQEIDRSVQ